MLSLCTLPNARPAQRPPRWSLLAAAVLVFATGAHAQRMHVGDIGGLQGLIGEPPDVSTWPHPAAPDGNPFPRSTAPLIELARRQDKILLGKALFWEEQVGIDDTMACGTCHDTGAGGTDGRGGALHSNGTFGSEGVIPQAVDPNTNTIDYGFVVQPTPTIDRLVTPIIAPPMIGAYLFNELFWDMRAGPPFQFEGGGVIPNFDDWAACEDLSVGPPLNDIEMGHEALTWSSQTLQAKLGNSMPLALCDPSPAKMPRDFRSVVAFNLDYDGLFDKVFQSDPDPTLAAGPGVTRERFAAAVAHYMRTLIPDGAPIDRGTMTISQRNGFNKLQSVGCFACHSIGGGVALQTQGGGFVDPFDVLFSDGRFHNVRGITVKTPTLRNVGLKKRFFTDGQVSDFPSLLAFYEGFFGFSLTTIEAGEVTDFLVNGLLDPRVAARSHPFDKPELASERPEHVFEGNEFGFAISGLSTPEIIANAPAHIPYSGGTSHFKVGVANCLPGSSAVLGLQFPPNNTIFFQSAVSVNPVGFATSHIVLPPQTGSTLIGVQVIGRWLVQDSGAPGGVAQSNSARWTMFQF